MGRPCKECGAKIGHLENRDICKLCEIEKPLREKIRVLEKALKIACSEVIYFDSGSEPCGRSLEDEYIKDAVEELKKEK